MLKEEHLRYDKTHNHLLDQNEIKRSIHHDFSSMVLTIIIKMDSINYANTTYSIVYFQNLKNINKTIIKQNDLILF